MGDHLIDGEFQSDKYPTTPRGKVPLSVKDPMAQDLLWQYAQRRRKVDAGFAKDLEQALRNAGYEPAPAPSGQNEAKALQLLLRLASAVYYAMDDSEQLQDESHKIEHGHALKICAVLDRLDTLPDDQPGYTMTPPAMARWHLRRLVTELGIGGADGDDDDSVMDCFACEMPIAVGDGYYPDPNGGFLHAECCGPEAYTGADGGPLKEGEPIPAPAIWSALP